MNSTNDNLPTNRHSIKAGVMGVRWLCAVASFILLKTKKGRAFYFPFGLVLSATALTPAAIGSANIKPKIPNPIAYNCFSDLGKNNNGIATPNIGSDTPTPTPILAFDVICKLFKVYNCKYTNNLLNATTFYGFAEVRGIF